MAKPAGIYVRNQGGEPRYYGDFRNYHDVGGKREPLIPNGAARATTDRRLATALYAVRVRFYEDRRYRRENGDPVVKTFLAEFTQTHLQKKQSKGGVTPQWCKAAEMHLIAAMQFFCNGGAPLVQKGGSLTVPQDRDIATITTPEVEQYVQWLAARSNGRGGTLSQGSQRKYLNSLSNLFRRAMSENRVSQNVVTSLLDKPQDGAGRREANWLEVSDAARLLDAAKGLASTRSNSLAPLAYPLIATLLLTGGRPAEVLGLEVSDVSFERETVTFRIHGHRRLKTRESARVLPLWPQLGAILLPYVTSRAVTTSKLLFPNPRTGLIIKDIRKIVDEAAKRVGYTAGDVRPYAFRHTYTAARLQTLDNGAPVSTYTVGQELGHGGDSLVKRVYGHLGKIRHRSENVEYLVKQREIGKGTDKGDG